jgi:hypothetical protein
LIYGLDDSHVGQAFLSGGLRRFVPENAIREVKQLGSELVPPLKFARFMPITDPDLHLDWFDVLVGVFEGYASFCSRHLVSPGIGRAKAANAVKEFGAGPRRTI